MSRSRIVASAPSSSPTGTRNWPARSYRHRIRPPARSSIEALRPGGLCGSNKWTKPASTSPCDLRTEAPSAQKHLPAPTAGAITRCVNDTGLQQPVCQPKRFYGFRRSPHGRSEWCRRRARALCASSASMVAMLQASPIRVPRRQRFWPI